MLMKSILRALEIRCPNLLSLEVGFPNHSIPERVRGRLRRHGVATPRPNSQVPSTFFSGGIPTFVHLRAFHLAIPTNVSLRLRPEESFGLLEFLTKHANKLRELTLPPFSGGFPALVNGETLSFDLRSLDTGLTVAMFLNSPRGGGSHSTVTKLTLDLRHGQGNNHPIRAAPELQLATLSWPYCKVQQLTLISPGSETDYALLPLFFPDLRDLDIKFDDHVWIPLLTCTLLLTMS